MSWWSWSLAAAATIVLIGAAALVSLLLAVGVPTRGRSRDSFPGQLDDVIVVALVLRSFVRADGGALVREHWPGPERTLGVVLRAAGLPT